jgi:hypothetical protein
MVKRFISIFILSALALLGSLLVSFANLDLARALLIGIIWGAVSATIIWMVRKGA